MSARLLTTIEPAPEGFRPCSLSKRLLLTGPLVLVTPSVQQVLALIEGGQERIEGILVTPAPEFAESRLGPLLWELRTPLESLPQLAHLLTLTLEVVEGANLFRERAILSERLAERARQEVQGTQDDYNRVAGKLLEDLQRSRRIAAENARLYAEAQAALRARDEFLSVASHELKTPLTPLKLVLQSIRRRLARIGDAKLESLVTNADRQVGRLTRLIESLLDVSLGTLTLRPEPVDLALLVHGVLDQLQTELERARCPLQVRSEQGLVGTWDPERLEQLVANLVSNAMKFGAGKPIEVVVERAGPMARLVVTDHGIGIPPEQQSRLFQRYQRAVSPTQYGGLGLGLYIVRQIVEAHGGTIELESRVGEGTTLRVELPLRTRAAEPR